LREKLRKIEALFAGAGTTGERLAAEAALERVRAPADHPLRRRARGEMLAIEDVLEILSVPLLGIIPESDAVRRASISAPPSPSAAATARRRAPIPPRPGGSPAKTSR
jgi:septum formation inhibitor-activating ATPase MinD